MKGIKLFARQYNHWTNSIYNIKEQPHPAHYSTFSHFNTKAVTIQKYLWICRPLRRTLTPRLKPVKPKKLQFFVQNLWRPPKINVRYRGKSFRVIQQRVKKRLVLRFSRCHKTYFYYPQSKLIYKKNKYFKLTTNLLPAQIERLGRLVWKIRKYNIYNKRGLHPRQFVVYHKKGKVSAYR